MPSRRKLRVYRSRTKRSRCRGLGRNTCRRRSGCRRASGTKRAFCRRSRNRKA